MKSKTHTLAFLCKTYRNDLQAFRKLYQTFQQHNVEHIPLYVSVPEEDLGLFSKEVDETVTLISDESYAEKYFSDQQWWGLSLGYINQEICKLSFWETGYAENYLCVDSDVYFIRDFYASDFMANDTTPYSVLVMDKDLNVENFYKKFGRYRADLVKKIFDTVAYDDRRMLTCHGMTVLNAKVLKSLKQEFMAKKNLSYKDLIEISPYEYTWYNAWLQKSQVIEIMAVEPFFKTFHMRIEYIFSQFKLITESDLATQYVGIVLNSNWKPKGPPRTYEAPGIFQKVVYKIIERLG